MKLSLSFHEIRIHGAPYHAGGRGYAAADL